MGSPDINNRQACNKLGTCAAGSQENCLLCVDIYANYAQNTAPRAPHASASLRQLSTLRRKQFNYGGDVLRIVGLDPVALPLVQQNAQLLHVPISQPLSARRMKSAGIVDNE
jgi:hypothetical protein